MSSLPDELWTHVFSNFSIIEKATRSDVGTWSDVTNVGPSALHLAGDARSHKLIVENLRQKACLSRVSKRFHRLSRPLMLELVDVRSYSSLLKLCRTVSKSRSFADDLGRYTLRLGINITNTAFQSYQINPFPRPRTNVKQRSTWNEEFRSLFRACRRLKHMSWLVAEMEDQALSSGLFAELPKLCPLVEVLFWYSSDKRKLSILDEFAFLRVLHYSWDYGQVGAEDIQLPLLHTLRGPLPLLGHFADTESLPSLHMLGIINTNSDRFDSGLDFNFRMSILTHCSKIRSIEFSGRNNPIYTYFQQLFLNATHAIVSLENAQAVLKSPWPTVECIALHPSPTMPMLGLTWQLCADIPRLKKQNMEKLQKIFVLDQNTVSYVRLALDAEKLSIAKRLCEEIEMLDEHGQPIWSFGNT